MEETHHPKFLEAVRHLENQIAQKQQRVHNPLQKHVILIFLIFLTLCLISGLYVYFESSLVDEIKPQPASYTECLAAPGSIIQESYPETCVTKTGLRFTRELSPEEKQSLY